MKFELNEDQLNNLLVFLDRVEFKGLKEFNALSDLLNCFTKDNIDKNSNENNKNIK